MFLNCSPNSSLTTLYNTLQNFLNTDQVFDIFLGDFDINVLNSTKDNLQHLFTLYALTVSEPTHINGSLRDHVYIGNNLM